MEDKINITRLIIAMVIGYALLFFFIWLFRNKKPKEEKESKEHKH